MATLDSSAVALHASPKSFQLRDKNERETTTSHVEPSEPRDRPQGGGTRAHVGPRAEHRPCQHRSGRLVGGKWAASERRC